MCSDNVRTPAPLIAALAFALAASMMWTTPAEAQRVQFGITGGINLGEINVSGDESLNVLLTDKMEPTGGMLVAVNLLKRPDRFWLQPEALLSVKGSRLEQNGHDDHVRLTYIEFPLLVRYAGPEDSAAPIHLFAGPYGAYLLHAAVESSGVPLDPSTNVKDGFKSFDFGLVAGVGIGFGRAGVDLRYTLGTTDIAAHSNLGGWVASSPGLDTLVFRTRTLNIVAAYRF